MAILNLLRATKAFVSTAFEPTIFCLAALALLLAPASVSAGSGMLEMWGDDCCGPPFEPQQKDEPEPKEVFTDFANFNGASLGLRVDGSIKAWGDDSYGLVSGRPMGAGYQDVTASRWNAFAVDAEGKIEGWGTGRPALDGDGFICDGMLTGVPAGSDYVSVVGGYCSVFALNEAGEISAWGDDEESGGLISGAPSGGGFTKVVASTYDTAFALTTEGEIRAWGIDAHGMVSDAPTGAGYLDVTVGTETATAVRGDGSLEVWGYGAQDVMAPPAGNDYIAVVGTEYDSVIALRADGTIVGWGADEDGQVSDVPEGRFHSIHRMYYAFAAIRSCGSLCGDGVLQTPEACDDGNTADGDCCSSTCELDPVGESCGLSPATCMEVDACDGLGTCVPGEPSPDGTTCSDADACTSGEACESGQCGNGASVVCASDDNVCTEETCDIEQGCVSVPLNVGTCDDGDPCTPGDACQNGTCAGGPPMDFDEDGVCDAIDLCPEDYGPQNLDSDMDGVGDVCDPCVMDPNDGCDVDGSIAVAVEASGGQMIQTPNGLTQLTIPADALQVSTVISITDSSEASRTALQVPSGGPPAEAIIPAAVQLGPPGEQFNVPVQVVLHWSDVDQDGWVDTASSQSRASTRAGAPESFQQGVKEGDLKLFHDGVEIAGACSSSDNQVPSCTTACCDREANTWTVFLDYFSELAVAAGGCGNSMLDQGEQCDDGGVVSLDGCSATCELEDLQTTDFELDRVTIRPKLSKPGQLKARGTVQTGREGVADVLDASGGVTVTITTGSGLTRTINWLPTECSTSKRGNIVCRTDVGPSSYGKQRLRLAPLKELRSPNGLTYRLRLEAGGLSAAETADLAGSVNIGLRAGSLVRLAELENCNVSKRGKLHCD